METPPGRMATTKYVQKWKKGLWLRDLKWLLIFIFWDLWLGYPDVQAEGLSDAVEIEGRNVKVPEWDKLPEEL